MIPRIVSRERLCTLCGIEGVARAADYRVEPAGGDDTVVSCSVHLGETVSMVMLSQLGSRVTVADLDKEDAE